MSTIVLVWFCAALFIEGLPRDRLEIWTDHQPLVPILSKYSLPEIDNKRLQRLRMKLDHLQFTIKWVKGKDNVEADTLSRAPCVKARADDELDENLVKQDQRFPLWSIQMVMPISRKKN